VYTGANWTGHYLLVIVTVALAEAVGSATLVALTCTVFGEGTLRGAV
jgi:hypothetical protein